MAELHYLKTGNLEPPLAAVLRLADGQPIDLSGATVRLLMRLASGASSAKVDAECIVVDAEAGHVQYSWVSADTDTAGLFDAEFEVTLPGGRKLSVPNDGQQIRVQITDDLR